jgi:phage shock protein B
MQPVLILVTIFGGIILSLSIIGGTIIFAMKIIRGGGSGRRGKPQSEEARMIQEIFSGLSRMEERVDALETLLLQKERPGHHE